MLSPSRPFRFAPLMQDDWRASFAAVPSEAWAIFWAFLVLTIGLGTILPFPTSFDELQHFSYVRAMQQAPTLMPAQGETSVLDQRTLSGWTAERNYLNHPPLYYLLLGAIAPADAGVLLLRMMNAVLTAAGAALVLIGGCRLLDSKLERNLFSLASVCFPKAAVMGATISNDNLANVAGAMVFAGVAGLAGAPFWIAAGLAIAGWTKLNALIALGVVAAVPLLRERNSRDWVVIAIGAGIGAIPYALNLATIGHLLWVDEARFWVAPEARLQLDAAGYVLHFLRHFAGKWGAVEYAGPDWLVAAGLLVPLILFAIGAFRERRLIVPAYALAFGITLAIHVGFGWESYSKLGDVTIAQPRYYAILWPGFSVAIAFGLARLWRWRRAAGWAGIGALLWPTAVGGFLIAAI